MLERNEPCVQGTLSLTEGERDGQTWGERHATKGAETERCGHEPGSPRTGGHQKREAARQASAQSLRGSTVLVTPGF